MSLKQEAEAYDAIDWRALEPTQVHAFYEAVRRPVGEQWLLFLGPVPDSQWAELRRRCVADYMAMQRRACPSCAA